jgi:short-subunit dehydrogenase
MRLRRGDVALITGASRGIGRHVAMALARQGMDLVLAARSLDGLHTVAEEVCAATGVTVSALTVDLGDREQAAALVPRAEAAAGRIDVLVNNAGLGQVYRPDEVPLEQLGAMTDVNLLAPMVLTRMVLPGMIERGRGHVVNIASMAGLLAQGYQEPYNATKFGLVGFTRALRLTAQDRAWAVSASAICPGFMSGEGMYADMQSEFGVTEPKMAAAMPVELVGPAVVKAIEKDLPAVTLMTGSPLALVVAATVAPRLFERLVRRLNLIAPFRTEAEQRGAAQRPDAGAS